MSVWPVGGSILEPCRLRQDSGSGSLADLLSREARRPGEAHRRAEREAEAGDAGKVEGRGQQDSRQVRHECGQLQDGEGSRHGGVFDPI